VFFATALVMACTALPASAQESPEEILQYLPGLKSANARSYVSTADELGLVPAGTPKATPASTGVSRVYATVLEFSNEITLTTTWAVMVNEDLFATISGESGLEFTVTRPDDLGDQALLGLGTNEHDETTGVLIVQDGNLGLLISAEGDDAEVVESTLRAFAGHMVAAEPGTGAVTIDPLNGSTGGTWDVLPGAEDTDLLGPLIPLHEYDLLASNSPIEATPES
jgi:hypothetical protein